MNPSGGAVRAALRSSLGIGAPALTLASVLVALFLLIPIVIIFPVSLTNQAFLTWPPDLFSTRWFESFFETPAWTDALLRSIRIAVPVAVIATVLGTLSALGMAYVGRGRRALQTLFIAPLVLPLITYALGLYDVTRRLELAGSSLPVIIGQSMLAAPLAFIVISAGLANRNAELPRAAASLGAPALTVLRLVELPLLRPSIAAAAIISLAYSFDEIVIAYFLSSPGSGTLPVQILGSTRESADPTIAAASVVVIAVAASIAGLALLARSLVPRRSA